MNKHCFVKEDKETTCITIAKMLMYAIEEFMGTVRLQATSQILTLFVDVQVSMTLSEAHGVARHTPIPARVGLRDVGQQQLTGLRVSGSL